MQTTHIVTQLSQKLASPCKYLENTHNGMYLKSGEEEDVKAVCSVIFLTK